MEYFKPIPGGRLPGIPEKPTNHIPVTIGDPNLQKSVPAPGVHYETKSFGNRDETKKRMMADIMARHPHLSQNDVSSIASTTTESHFGIIEDDKKNKNYLAAMDIPLPEGTEWKDIKIFIDKFDVKHPSRSTIRILLKGKSFRTTNFHEMRLENTKEGIISDGGKILYFMSLGCRFAWYENEEIPQTQRKIKERLSEDLQLFFGLKADSFVLENGEYKPLFQLSIREQSVLQKRYSRFLQKTAFELLNDSLIFSSLNE